MLKPFRKISVLLSNFRHLAWISCVFFFLILGSALLVVYPNQSIMHRQKRAVNRE